MTQGEEDRKVSAPDKGQPEPPPRPPLDLHDPFGRFNFEPTDGGDF
jgi:hypothetical protein